MRENNFTFEKTALKNLLHYYIICKDIYLIIILIFIIPWIEIMDITFTTDGKHQFETPSVEVPNEGPISNISLPSGFKATYEKNEQGEQKITYSESPKYKTFDINSAS